MTYRATVAVSSETLTEHSKQNQHNVEFFNIKPGGT